MVHKLKTLYSKYPSMCTSGNPEQIDIYTLVFIGKKHL